MNLRGRDEKDIGGETTARRFLLGAGFSKPAGLPLANELLPMALDVARIHLSVDQFSHLEDALTRYQKYLLDTSGSDLIDIEQFGAWLDWDHMLQMQGSDTFSDFGNEAGLQLRWAIGKVINESTPAELPDVYLEFASQLNSTDHILTLNYDLILEKALDAVGLPYRRFPDRFSEVYESHQIINPSQPDEVVIHKLHGSIDWTYLWGDSVKGHPGTVQLVEGPRHIDDPLNQIGVIPQHLLNEHYKRRSNWHSSPSLLLPPSTAKPLARSPLVPIWRGIGTGAGWLGGFIMIGCSLPPGDPYVKQFVYQNVTEYAIARRIQAMPWPQRKMKVVDLRREATEIEFYKHQLRFFDPDSTVFHLEGFDQASLEVIFQED
jgi:hypothetical protein